MISEYRLSRHPGTELSEDKLHRDTSASNHRLPAHDVRINLDAVVRHGACVAAIRGGSYRLASEPSLRRNLRRSRGVRVRPRQMRDDIADADHTAQGILLDHRQQPHLMLIHQAQDGFKRIIQRAADQRPTEKTCDFLARFLICSINKRYQAALNQRRRPQAMARAMGGIARYSRATARQNGGSGAQLAQAPDSTKNRVSG